MKGKDRKPSKTPYTKAGSQIDVLVIAIPTIALALLAIASLLMK